MRLRPGRIHPGRCIPGTARTRCPGRPLPGSGHIRPYRRKSCTHHTHLRGLRQRSARCRRRQNRAAHSSRTCRRKRRCNILLPRNVRTGTLRPLRRLHRQLDRRRDTRRRTGPIPCRPCLRNLRDSHHQRTGQARGTRRAAARSSSTQTHRHSARSRSRANLPRSSCRCAWNRANRDGCPRTDSPSPPGT